MSLPQLWASVTLRSYSSIRYTKKDDRNLPEGFGSASPFSMGLNALVTHNVPHLVKRLALEGDWTARDLDEYSRVGRVSEQTMILNIAVRAAVDRCVNLENLKWDLDTKLLPNVYDGIAALKNLQHLWLRFPSSRAPQPTVDIPSMPNLSSFVFTNYDPLCYPDDISSLIFHSTNLRELQMHFSPRMREVGEPSVQLSYLFRKNIASGRKLGVQKLGVYNLFARAEMKEMMQAVEPSRLEDMTSLNTFGRDEYNGADSANLATEFLDREWMADVEHRTMHRKSLRIDQLHRRHATSINKGLERLYLVNARYGKTDIPIAETPETMESSPSATSGSGNSGSNRLTPVSKSTGSGQTASDKLRDLYFDRICDEAGPTLKHLIFPARWGMSIHQLARLIRSCPSLTQLSIFFDCLKFDMLRMLVPFLSKLYAIRLIVPPNCPHKEWEKTSEVWQNRFEDAEEQERRMRTELARGDFGNLKYIGLSNVIWEVGGMEEVQAVDSQKDGSGSECPPEPTEGTVWRRQIRRITMEDVQHVEIWKCDTMDIV